MTLAGRGENVGELANGTWRLPGLGGAWGFEEQDIRLPPLPPGACFRDHYDVRVPSQSYYSTPPRLELLSLRQIQHLIYQVVGAATPS